MKRIKVVIAALACSAILPCWAWGGLVIESVDRSTGGGNQGASKTVVYIQNNVNKEWEGDDEEYSIVDLNKGTITMVEPKERQYCTMTLDDARRTGTELSKAAAEQMKSLSPEQRAAMQNVFGALKPKNYKLVKTGQSAKIAGYEADQYQLLENGKLDTEYWVSPEAGKVVGKEFDPKKAREVIEAMGAMSSAAMASMGIPTESVMQRAKLEAQLAEKGYILKEISYSSMSMSQGDVNETVSIQEKNIPASEFEPPPGFQKANCTDLMELGNTE